jgi:hypothetical protein
MVVVILVRNNGRKSELLTKSDLDGFGAFSKTFTPSSENVF